MLAENVAARSWQVAAIIPQLLGSVRFFKNVTASADLMKDAIWRQLR
jgi:hypothetical protein